MGNEPVKEDPAPADPQLVRFMSKGGMSGRSISKALKLPYTKVLRWLKEE